MEVLRAIKFIFITVPIIGIASKKYPECVVYNANEAPGILYAVG